LKVNMDHTLPNATLVPVVLLFLFILSTLFAEPRVGKA